jgi:hexosaminidase
MYRLPVWLFDDASGSGPPDADNVTGHAPQRNLRLFGLPFSPPESEALMRHPSLSILAATLTLVLPGVGCDSTVEMPMLVPKPESVVPGAGRFQLTGSTRLVVSDALDAELLRLAEGLAEPMRRATGWPMTVEGPGAREADAIRLTLEPSLDSVADLPETPLTRDESYALSVTESGIVIEAATHAGLFYGIQTLRQLLPLELATGMASDEVSAGWAVPALEIEDRPRFVYRGLHLDVGRHFFPPEFIKRYIDLLAAYKLNVFHWHLTEDQGWRLEIDRYPRLTEVGAYRAETILEKHFDPYVGDGIPYGGFYTKDEVRHRGIRGPSVTSR